ncbi:MAG: hypothetical protein KF744_09265 [Taibaiella sp.]|nr:hypothetical protein [Taibaiella sp.]
MQTTEKMVNTGVGVVPEKFRKRKLLTKYQVQEIKKWAKGFGSDVEAADAAGLAESTYRRIMELKRGNSENVGKLLAAVMPPAEPTGVKIDAA